MLAFVTLFIEHFFTEPADVLANTLSLLLLLVPLKNKLTKLGIWYDVILYYSFVMFLFAFFSLYLLNSDKTATAFSNKLSRWLKNVVTFCGRGKFLFASVFLSTLFFYVDSNSPYFLALFLFCFINLVIDPKKMVFSLSKKQQSGADVGVIFGVQSKNTFLVKLYENSPRINLFDIVEFKYSMEKANGIQKGVVVDNYLLNQEQWIKVLATKDIQQILHEDVDPPIKGENVVYKIESKKKEEILKRLVGFVIDKSNIAKVRFQYSSRIDISEGQLLELYVGSQKILYQVVQGVTETELLESKNETGYIVGEAIQLGIWHFKDLSFEKFGWVPDINTPVYVASDESSEGGSIELQKNEFIVGTIPPKTNYPVVINKEQAITYHLTILGVTGCGKSVFARNLIREIVKDGSKVICVDFTNEYLGKFSDLKIKPIVEGGNAQEIFKAIDAISSEMDKFPNQRIQGVISRAEQIIQNKFYESIKNFLLNDSLAIFELPDVTNTTGILEYTKWFFRILFKIAREEKSFGNRICVVLEEAHTVVPELNFLGISEKISQSLVNSIGQIALQGRKYNIGFVVIAQRTANVSKTVLTQCNSIIAFQCFDKTSNDFLSNYLGKEMVEALPNLKFRQAIAVGKAFKSNIPLIFEIPEIKEP